MANRDGSVDVGRNARRSDDVRADRHHESAELSRRSRVQSRSQGQALGRVEAEERRRLRPASISVVRLDSMGRNRRIVRFILALALAIVGALGAIYVLFFAAGGYYVTSVASAIFLGAGLFWLSNLIDARSPRG